MVTASDMRARHLAKTAKPKQYADGGAVDPTSWGATPVADNPAAWGAVPAAPPQSQSMIGKALEPITSYPSTYQQMN